MTQGLIGVIVPVYKVEKYIAKCIESILAQTYSNFRLILVDDGTPDNAGKICDEYAKKDSRITIIHQENAGVTRARARGVQEGKDCEFITFVDGDDTLPIEAIQDLLLVMENGFDIVITDNVLDYPTIEGNSITATKFQEMLICEKVSSAPWGKLFRKELFNDFVFEIPRKIIMGEDLIMNLRLAHHCKKKIGVIHKQVYNYNMHLENVSHNFKDSAEHEYLFYSNIRFLLPRHSNHIIARSLKKWRCQFGYSYKKPLWFDSKIHKALKEDIKQYNYNIDYLEYALLRIKNPIIRYLIIFIKKCRNIIKSMS